MTSPKFQFLSYTEILSKYPQTKDLGWNESSLGLFLSSYLLLGLPTYKRRKGVVDDMSIRALINFTNDLTKAHIIRSDAGADYCAFDYLTPAEIVEEYPQIVKLLGWNETKLGKFLKARLLIGRITPTGQSNLITRRSFDLLIKHATGTINRRVLLIQMLNRRFS